MKKRKVSQAEYSSIKGKEINLEGEQLGAPHGVVTFTQAEFQKMIDSINSNILSEQQLLEKLQTIAGSQKSASTQVSYMVHVPSGTFKRTKENPSASGRYSGLAASSFEDQCIQGEQLLPSLTKSHLSNPAQIRIVTKPPFRSARDQSVPQASHTFVVETPETFYLRKGEFDFKQRLDIKIRCPVHIIQNGLLDLIQERLTLKITLIYFDGTHKLQDIKKGLVPTYERQNVHINKQGFICWPQNEKLVTRCNLFDDIFFDSVDISELNFK